MCERKPYFLWSVAVCSRRSLAKGVAMRHVYLGGVFVDVLPASGQAGRQQVRWATGRRRLWLRGGRCQWRHPGHFPVLTVISAIAKGLVWRQNAYEGELLFFKIALFRFMQVGSLVLRFHNRAMRHSSSSASSHPITYSQTPVTAHLLRAFISNNSVRVPPSSQPSPPLILVPGALASFFQVEIFTEYIPSNPFDPFPFSAAA